MSTPRIIGAIAALALAALCFAVAVPYVAVDRGVESAAPPPPAPTPASTPAPHSQSGFLYGRVAADGVTYEGRLRWGGDQEAFWGDFFDGFKPESPWQAYAPGEPGLFEVFGIEIGGDRPNLARPFLARFGDIARLDARFSRVQVTLKSGTVIALDRFAAGDIDDGVRVWDRARGVVDLDARLVRAVEFLPTPPLSGAPERLHGTVLTRRGEFTGFIQWNQRDSVSTDVLHPGGPGSEHRVRFDAIRSIVRESAESARVTLDDGRDVVLSTIGRGHRGIYVEDARYGRVLIPWDAFARVDFRAGGSGPAYDDFPPGTPLAGSVMTRDGRTLAGRLVYDFDESDTIDTFDVGGAEVGYNMPFGLLASIVPRAREGDLAATATLHDGEELTLTRSGDLGGSNAGVLVFGNGRDRPEYVPWGDVERIDLERPAAMYPPVGEH